VTALLEVDRLVVEIGGARILDGVGFSLERGGRLGIVGESGCGKSMTALAVMGLLPDGARASGRVLLDGKDLLRMDEAGLCALRGRRIGMVFQEPMSALDPVRTIGHQVAESLRWHLGLGRGLALARAEALLARVGLPVPRFSPRLYPHQLSGGQRQRVVLAIALACGPDLLIADEPTTALDVTIQAQILDLIAGIVEGEGMALVMISHDLGVVAETTGRLAVMYAGRIVEEGTTEAVFRRRAHPYTRGLFAARPQELAQPALARGARLATIPGRVPDPRARPPGCVFAPRCPRASALCRREPPPLEALARGHAVACFHPHDEDHA
jgi:peptide/nickel transport system ATP-binding protein